MPFSKFRKIVAFILMLPQLLSANLMQSSIEHVVVVILENRSFDNLLAWAYSEEVPLRFLPGKTDPHYLGLSEETLLQYTNVLTNTSGEVVFSSPPIKGIPSVAGTPYLNSPMFDPYEPFPHVLVQIFGSPAGKQPVMTGFLQDYASHWIEDEWMKEQKTICAVMETYTESELPVMYGLGRHYAISDLWFSSVPTQTNPNRAFAACGTSEGQVVNGPLGKSQFFADTIWNRLIETSPNTTWKIFWQADMLPAIFPGPFTGPNTFANMKKIPNLSSYYAKIDAFHELARNGQLPHFSFIEPQMTTSANLEEKARMTQEMRDINLLLGVQGNDYHPPGDVRTAENLLANIYTSLISNQDAWNKTLLIVTFDEHGGLFDHMPPPPAIPPDNMKGDGFSFDRYGVRVPAIFISPLIGPRTVVRSKNPQIPFDHTSLIATLLKWQGVSKTQWNMGNRVAAAPTFDSVITLKTPRLDSDFQPKSIPQPLSSNIVQFGDPFYLRDQDGNYIVKSSFLFKWLPRVGSEQDKIALTLGAGAGSLTHGSFALIQVQDTELDTDNYLESSDIDGKCLYSSKKHEPRQWWTVFNADRPFLGAPIQYGDRVYLDNHIYLDLFQYVPSRLTKDSGLLSDLLTTQPITDPDSNAHYWVIERG